MLYTLYTH